MWGAILTLAQKIFILIVALIGILDLFSYKDPNITQYKMFDKRNDDTEYNLAENYANFLIGFGTNDGNVEPIDPRYGSIKLSQSAEVDEDDDEVSLAANFEVPLDFFTKDNFPSEYESFMDDSTLKSIAPALLSSKEFARLSL